MAVSKWMLLNQVNMSGKLTNTGCSNHMLRHKGKIGMLNKEKSALSITAVQLIQIIVSI